MPGCDLRLLAGFALVPEVKSSRGTLKETNCKEEKKALPEFRTHRSGAIGG
jgi:hypothetical protein